MKTEEYEQLVRNIRPGLVRMAVAWLPDGEQAEDAVQETLCKLWLIRSKVDSQRKPEALVTTMLRNLLASQLRSASPAHIPIDNLPDEEAAEQEEESENQMAEVLALVAKLPSLQQAILLMRHIDGLEISEIVRLTEGTPESVRANLSRARRRVRDEYLERKRHE